MLVLLVIYKRNRSLILSSHSVGYASLTFCLDLFIHVLALDLHWHESQLNQIQVNCLLKVESDALSK